MLHKDTLKQKLASIDKRDYGHYQKLVGSYDFSFFKLIIQQIPKDPFAPPHTGIYRIQVGRTDERIINMGFVSKVQKVAFADYLSRCFYDASQRLSKGVRGTGHSGIITINEPGQCILERNSVVITDDIIEVRCFLGLPAEGRIITADIAQQMFFTELPKIVKESLLRENIDHEAIQRHLEVAEDTQYLRDKLDSLGLIAFIANGSVLPRQSGTSDKPMRDKKAIPFMAPESLTQAIELPHVGMIKGLAIKKGITLIAGGGYHGKSTLLDALETCIYNHIPSDGREYCVSSVKTAKVRAYSGRHVAKTDISPFINNLPFNQDTTSFSTNNASGSTSQAANIIEAIEAGAEVLLMDEDTCATNFMIRDSKMQQLVHKKDEPITTFIDKVKQLYEERNISTILVLGGVGEYFDVADSVIQMINYEPFDVTHKAHRIANASPTEREVEGEAYPVVIHERIPLPQSIDSLSEYGKFRIYAKETHHLNFGKEVIDLTDLEQLVEVSQTKALGYAIEYAKKYMNNKATLREIVEHVESDIEEKGLDVISDKISGHFAGFRSLELAFAMNRFRGFDVIQKKREE